MGDVATPATAHLSTLDMAEATLLGLMDLSTEEMRELKPIAVIFPMIAESNDMASPLSGEPHSMDARISRRFGHRPVPGHGSNKFWFIHT